MISILDVSSYQGSIDWPRAKASGSFDAAYAKLCEGVSGEGSTDPYGVGNLQRGRAAGVPMGGYAFLSALSPPDQQAQHFLQQLAAAGQVDLAEGLPAMLDLERGANGQLPPAEWVGVWMQIVEQATGKTPLLYTGAWVAALDHLAQHPEYARYPGWVAAYTDAPAPPPCAPWGPWGEASGPLVWQYTPRAVISGLPNPCDLSRAWSMPGAASASSAS